MALLRRVFIYGCSFLLHVPSLLLHSQGLTSPNQYQVALFLSHSLASLWLIIYDSRGKLLRFWQMWVGFQDSLRAFKVYNLSLLRYGVTVYRQSWLAHRLRPSSMRCKVFQFGQWRKTFIYSVTIFRTAMHLAAERGHTSTVEFLAGQSENARKRLIFAVRDDIFGTPPRRIYWVAK